MSKRTASWLAWSAWALSLTLTALSLLLLTLTLSHAGVPIFEGWLEETLIAMGWSTVGAVVASRRPENTVGWLFCTVGLLIAVDHFCAQYGIYTFLAPPGAAPAGEMVVWVTAWRLWVPTLAVGVFLLLLFPDGRLPSSAWRWFAWLCVLLAAVGTVFLGFSPGPLVSITWLDFQNPFGIDSLPNRRVVVRSLQALLFALILIAAGSMFVRMRRARGVERQQIKWFAYATVTAASGFILARVVSSVMDSPWLEWVGSVILIAGVMGIPISMGIAILRYRLYEIDLIINRTLVYGALTASVIGFYVLVVGGLGALFQAQQGNLVISLLATGIVAVVFQPLRARLQHGVNHLMYGERDEPYKVLSRLGQRLEATLTPGAVLPTVVGTLKEALKLPYAAIEIKRDGTSFETAASAGKEIGDSIRLPLAYGGKTVGWLVLGPRVGSEGFTPAESPLLHDLARQVGVVVHTATLTEEALRLSADLQHSRERLVTAQEEERRRLRRDLHDGLGPQLASLTMKAEASRELMLNDPVRADKVLEGLAQQAQAAVADVRRLVYALRPPALDALGLLGALRSQATQLSQDDLRISVEGPEELPMLSAAVEVACYRIVLEALNNVVRHADARNCTVRLALEEETGVLRLEVEDDGRGIGEDRRSGVGLTSMRERAEELGGSCTIEPVLSGGTRVRALLHYAHEVEQEEAVVESEASEPNLKEV